MQFVFQFPVIDLRQVLQPSDTIALWPSADMSKAAISALMQKAPFIRNFGKIESGPAGYFCNINCIKSDKLQDNGFKLNDITVPVFNCNKRLYAEGAYTTKVEFGFTDQFESILKYNAPEEPVHIPDILSHYLAMPLDVQDMAGGAKDDYDNNSDPNYWRTIKLSELGPVLTSNYSRATAKNKEQQGDDNVVCGEACITLAFASDNNIVLPANAEKLDEFTVVGQHIILYGYKWNLEGLSFKVWLFQLPSLELMTDANVIQELQNRRMNLFRLNAEKETMRILVNGFDPQDPHPGVAKYIKKTPIKINKKERFSTSQDAVRDFALQSEKEKVQFTLDDLKKTLDGYGLDNLKNLGQKMQEGPKRKKILFITSSPTETNPTDFGEQFKKIKDALQYGTDRDYFDLLNIETGVERNSVMQILYTKEPDYIHITLHNSEINGLYFQDAVKKPDPMPVNEFADYIKDLNDLNKPEVIILSACNSLAHANAVKQYCNFAIGTNYVFPDNAAIVYANKFYNALFNGKKVSFCHRVAVQGIKYNKPPFDAIDDKEVYDIPQLIQPT